MEALKIYESCTIDFRSLFTVLNYRFLILHSSGMQHHVSSSSFRGEEKHAVSILYPVDESSIFLPDAGIYLPLCLLSHPNKGTFIFTAVRTSDLTSRFSEYRYINWMCGNKRR
jgi:hypothetical protein